MGKATIISSLGEGKYRVQVHYDRSRAEAQITRLQAELAEIDAALPQLQQTIDSALIDLDWAEEVLSAAIAAYRVEPTAENQQKVKAAQESVRDTQTNLRAARAAKSTAELRRAAALKRIEFLQANLPSDTEADAWCADYSEALTGEVGTIEPARAAGDGLPVLYPGGEAGDQAGHDSTRDGQLQPVLAGTPASAAWNYAMLPGADRWRPRYRIGEITSLDSEAGLADVALDPLTSTHQDLDVNQSAVLADVPIQYMDCHAAAFELGDRVVVEFQGQDWALPRVIGFESEPRECSAQGLACRVGDTPQVLRRPTGVWQAKARPGVLYGNIDWRGEGETVLSWWGVPTRHFDVGNFADPSAVRHLIPGLCYARTDNIWYTIWPTRITQVLQALPPGGTLSDVLDAGTLGQYATTEPLFTGPVFRAGKVVWSAAETRICGAALHGTRMIVVSADDFPDSETITILDVQPGGSGANPRVVAATNYPNLIDLLPGPNQSPWFFNQSGTEAVAVRMVGVYQPPTNNYRYEYHKFRLSVNWATEAVTVTDLGNSGRKSTAYSRDLDITPRPDISADAYDFTDVSSTATENVLEVYDYNGDVEIIAAVRITTTADTNSSGRGAAYGGTDIYGTVDAGSSWSAVITLGGLTAVSLVNQYARQTSLTGATVTVTGSVGSMSPYVGYLDLRSGLVETSVNEGETVWSYTEVHNDEIPETSGGHTTTRSFNYGLCPGVSSNGSGDPVYDTPGQVYTFGSYLFSMLNMEDFAEVHSDTETEAGPYGYGYSGFSGYPVAGRAAFYPGNQGLTLVSFPVAVGGYGHIGEEWPGQIFNALTGGDIAELVGVGPNQPIAPIGAL
jgi:hypothetical protein